MKTYTKAQLQKITKPGLYRVADTLYYRLAPGGSSQWVQRLLIDGKRKDIGLGSTKLITLPVAIEKSVRNRIMVLDGENPIVKKKAVKVEKTRKANMPTFADVEKATFKAMQPTWKSKRTISNWQGSMTNYVLPVIGDKPIDEIEQGHILQILVPIWQTKADSARKIRQRVTACFRLAMAHGYIATNPAGEVIDGALPKQKAGGNFQAMQWQSIPAFIKEVDRIQADIAIRECIKWVTLTACRTGEGRAARWDEIQGDTWVIPASRMKAGRDHVVPLTDAMMEILETMRGADDTYIFSIRQGQPIGNGTMLKALEASGLKEKYKTTIHGLRASFKSWSLDTGKDRQVTEAALAHSISSSSVEGAYIRTDLIERRRILMEQWEQFVTGQRGKVLKIA